MHPLAIGNLVTPLIGWQGGGTGSGATFSQLTTSTGVVFHF
jgi:hypothetical protein